MFKRTDKRINHTENFMAFKIRRRTFMFFAKTQTMKQAKIFQKSLKNILTIEYVFNYNKEKNS